MRSIATEGKHELGLLLLCFALILLPALGQKDFFTRGEPREALIAQNMLSTGNWIAASGYGGEVPAKPPMTHWLISLSSLPLGKVTEYTSRLPSAVCSLLFVVYFFHFVRRRLGAPQAILGCVFLFSSLEWYRSSEICRVDMVHSAFLACGIFGLWKWIEHGQSGWPLPPIAALCGATLAKGPVSILLPLAILAAFGWIGNQRFKEILIASVKLAVPVLAVAGTWYTLAYFRYGDPFLQRVLSENVDRLTGQMEYSGHLHSPLYLYGMLLVGLLPWTLPFLAVLASALRRDRSCWKWPFTRFKSLPPMLQYMAIYVLVFLIFYSLPSSKRGVYLLPAYPAICLLAAEWFNRTSEENLHAFRRALKIGLAFFVLAYSGLLTVTWMHMEKFLPSGELASLGLAIRDLSLFSQLLLLLPPATALWAIQRIGNEDIRRRLAPLATCALTGILLPLNLTLIPALANALSPRDFADKAASILPADVKLYSFKYEFYPISFYLERSIQRAEIERPGPGSYIFLFEKELEKLKTMTETEVLVVARSTDPILKNGQHALLVAMPNDATTTLGPSRRSADTAAAMFHQQR
jgi:4-amino-4-deoxy-L-arabinose transferase-like glycosyltransferase